ncbi:MAG: glycosyltransferase [Sphingobacteriales bacterium]|nr:MAG: glycosyltransferase [Sphingobacteriales bacterium]
MPHGMLDPYFQRAKGRKIKALRNLLFWVAVEQHLINNAAALLFTCQTERLLAREPFGPYRPKKQLVVGLGVDQPPPYTAEMTAALKALCPEIGTGPYLLFLSRIHPKKGLDLLIDAYLQAQEKFDNMPRLLIAGPGIDTSYGQQIAAKAKGNNEIVFGGMLTGMAKWGAFYGCEAFILPSHQENFGIAVVEALACGKPVLISDQVNIYREIQSNNAGIVKSDTEKGTVALLETWLEKSAEEKVKLAEGARRAYERYYSPGNAGKAMMEVFKID